MRLTDETPDPAAEIARRLDARLRTEHSAPIAIGFSGGGDSLALLLAADRWARAHGRELAVLTLDHRLQAQSAAWTTACGEVAAGLGRPFAALEWTGPKPSRGLPAAARAARHRLLAEAARRAGARVILLGHTADDVAEAQAMRAAGSTTPAPREWAPSPAWPQGRGLFLLRPMLGLGRAGLRAWLTAQGRSWIEDPANDNPAYARARARAALAAGGQARPATPEPAPDMGGLAAAVRAEPWGGLALDRRALREAPPQAARAVVAAACLCAAGTSRPPRADRLDRLTAALTAEGEVVATLAGARIETHGETALVLRETGELARGGLGEAALAPGEATVWDGRFELTASLPGLVVRPLHGGLSRLDEAQRRALATVPASARGGLPMVLGDADGPACPLARPVAGLSVKALAADRFAAACGLVQTEPG
ncbi:tRNA lysidine(34) synthetase TilS [Phenylobacterium sp.]|uniref:tRNA lysidine(34) synthetase TilS n=1 Tax=Phenylobacterium sp. TaxID=1871053 RepID=UPI0035B4AD2C